VFLAEALDKKVATLPEKMRAVVVLRFQEDLKLTEIAEVLDMPVNTVKTTLRRALARLRDKVAAGEGEVCYGTAGR
jgi:RNA polymerase sigma-70 factor (ECF subfamily)